MNAKTITLALIASALIPTAASADSARETVSGQVAYRDLDLTDASGRDRLEQRLTATVRRVCGSYSGRELAQLADVRRCRREALATAANGRELALASSTRRASMALAATVPTPGK